MMLTAQAFLLLLRRWARNELDLEAVPKSLMYQAVPRTLLDILGRTMRSQQDDGSWESKREVTAYAVLTLAPLLSLPWVDFLKPEGIACMYRGKAYLENNRHQWRVAERVWVEKTVYGSPNLSQAYCLAALKIVVPTMFVSARISDMFPSQVAKKIAKMSGFFAQVIPFSCAPKWKLHLSLFQSAGYAVALKACRYDIFPPIEKASDEKYQEYIPFTWIGCRDSLSTPIPSQTLWEMMLVSMSNFQIDAYMETVVFERYSGRLPKLKDLIRSLCGDRPQKRKRAEEDESGAFSENPANGSVANGWERTATNGALKCQKQEHSNGHHIHANGNQVHANGNQVHANGNQVRANGNQVHANGNQVHANGNQFRANGNQVHTNDKDIQLDSKDVQMNGKGVHTNGKDIHQNRETRSKNPALSDIPVDTFSTEGSNTTSDEKDKNVEEVLTRFVNFALQHPKVLASPAPLRRWLAHELQTFLLAHITHMEDCEALAQSATFTNGSVTWGKPRTTFFSWVRTTSADHTSCPYSFVFFLCLIGEDGGAMKMNVHQRYALEDACRHLATMCRQYNDLGSVARDQEEKNLNSVNFPEFDVEGTNATATLEERTNRKKRDLLAIAEYERRCLDRVIAELEPSLDARVMEKLRLFIQVTDLYGQIYVVRDIGIRRVEGDGAMLKA